MIRHAQINCLVLCVVTNCIDTYLISYLACTFMIVDKSMSSAHTKYYSALMDDASIFDATVSWWRRDSNPICYPFFDIFPWKSIVLIILLNIVGTSSAKGLYTRVKYKVCTFFQIWPKNTKLVFHETCRWKCIMKHISHIHHRCIRLLWKHSPIQDRMSTINMKSFKKRFSGEPTPHKFHCGMLLFWRNRKCAEIE